MGAYGPTPTTLPPTQNVSCGDPVVYAADELVILVDGSSPVMQVTDCTEGTLMMNLCPGVELNEGTIIWSVPDASVDSLETLCDSCGYFAVRVTSIGEPSACSVSDFGEEDCTAVTLQVCSQYSIDVTPNKLDYFCQ